MYHSNLFKTVLWVLVAVDLTYFLLIRSTSMISGTATLFDAVVFVGWLFVFFMPMFFDIGIFELKFGRKSNVALSTQVRADGT